MGRKSSKCVRSFPVLNIGSSLGGLYREARRLKLCCCPPTALKNWPCHRWSREPPCVRLIAYAQHPPKNVRWHLIRKHGDNHPSLLEFAGVLKQIATLLETNQIDPEDRRHFEESPPLAEVSDELMMDIDNPSSRREEKTP